MIPRRQTTPGGQNSIWVFISLCVAKNEEIGLVFTIVSSYLSFSTRNISYLSYFHKPKNLEKKKKWGT